MVAGIGVAAAATTNTAAAAGAATNAVGTLQIYGSGQGYETAAVAGDFVAAINGPRPHDGPALLKHATLVGEDGQVLMWTRGEDMGPYPKTYSNHLVVEGSPSCEDAVGRMRTGLWVARLTWDTGDVVMVWGHSDMHGWEFWPRGAEPQRGDFQTKYGHSPHRDELAAFDSLEILHSAIMFGVSILNPTSTPDDMDDLDDLDDLPPLAVVDDRIESDTAEQARAEAHRDLAYRDGTY